MTTTSCAMPTRRGNSSMRNLMVRFTEEPAAIIEQQQQQQQDEDNDEDILETKWFNRQDFDAMQADADEAFQMMMMMMRSGGEKHPERYGHCYRGLESRKQDLDNARHHIESFARRACKAVLREQHRQDVHMEYDANAIATIYRAYSTLCSNQAVRLANADYAEAKRILNEEQQQQDRKSNSMRSMVEIIATNKKNTGNLPVFAVNSDDELSVSSDLSLDDSIANHSFTGRMMSGANKKTPKVMIARIRRMMGSGRKQQTARTERGNAY